MSSDNIIKFLKEIELFSDLKKEQIQLLVKGISQKKLKNTENLFIEGYPRTDLYLIYQGKIELYKKDSFGKEQSLRLFGDNDFLAEGALMNDDNHSTSARAIQDTEVLCLSRKHFTDFSEEHPEMIIKILSKISKVISRRMRHTTDQAVGIAAQYISGKTRREHDLLGERDVSEESYYGVQTLRAIENFPITGIPISHFPDLIKAHAQIKMAAARANRRLGHLDAEIAEAIEKACEEIIGGKYLSHFAVDMIQGGAGTSTNMNANEVIANRTLELLGHKKGEYEYCHPNTHVNMAQSTNDVYPTGLNIGLYYLNIKLIESLKELITSFSKKAEEFKDIIKMGRTQLQDAVPMTLGQEFAAYSSTLKEEITRLEENAELFLEVNMGATAIGTGITADPDYSRLVMEELRKVTGLDLKLADDLVEATSDTGAFVIFSSAVKRLAVKLSKISNDLRLLSSGPRAGLNEINLPKMQPGSSIMPGKVNPVIPEVVNQIAYKVIGNDLTVTLAAEAGQLQLNVMEPVIAQSIFESIQMLIGGMRTLKYRCIDGITANPEVCRAMVERSIGLVTALNPILGYEKSSKLAKEALETGESVYELVLKNNFMTKEKLEEILKPENMIKPVKW
jgi:aspartate ammonia-lyase